MKRKHLAYPISEPVQSATRAFMGEKPWREESDFLALAQPWANEMVRQYSVPPVNIIPSNMDTGYRAAQETPDDGITPARICISSNSMIRLFIGMGYHLAANDKLDEGPLAESFSEEQATAWGYGVFYRANPKMFRARVREGRILLDPFALYSSATEQALRDYDIDPSDPRALTMLAEAQRDAISDALENDESEAIAPEADQIDAQAEPISETPTTTAQRSTVTVSPATHDEYRAMNTRQLRVTATAMGLTGTWGMNKATLLAALGVPTEAEVR